MNTWIPLADLTEVDSPAKFIRFAFNSLTPLASEPIEQFFNFDAFFRRAIERYPGEREHFLGFVLQKRVARVLRNARLLNEADRVLIPLMNKQFGLEIGLGTDRLKDMLAQQEFGDLLFRGLSGIKIRRVDLTRAKQTMVKRLQRDLRGLRTKLKFARRDNDQANVQQTQRVIAQTKQLLQVALGFDPVANPHVSSMLVPELLELASDAGSAPRG